MIVAAPVTSEGMTKQEKSRWRYARKVLGFVIPLRKRGNKGKQRGEKFDARNSPFITQNGNRFYKVHEDMLSKELRVKVPMV